MANQNVAVLDFGSSKLTVLVGSKGVARSATVKAKGVSDYAGFMDGEFLDVARLTDSIKGAILEAESMGHVRIKQLYVGVPAEFSYNICKPLDLFFNKSTKIRPVHLKRLFQSQNGLAKPDTHTIINQTPIYFKLDSGEKVTHPEGYRTMSLHALASFVYVDNYFIETVMESVSSLGIKHVKFISNALSESLYLISPTERAKGSILIDCGYITTSIAHVMGEGVLDLKSFSLGGGHVSRDLGELLDIPFEVAEDLKRKLVISLDAKPQDYYETVVEGESSKFSAKMVNNIALARIDMIGQAIEKCFAEFSFAPENDEVVYVTGGGLAYIKGMKDYLSKLLKKNVVLINPAPLQFDKPDLSSELALLEIAVEL